MPAILTAPTRISMTSTEVPVDEHDFSRFDGYFDDLAVIYLGPSQGGNKDTRTLELRPTRQDIGQSEFEARPDYGDWFSQGDFSHGMGQRFYHRPSRDPDKYLYSEGFDISEPGLLRHLDDAVIIQGGGTLTDPVAIEVFNDLPFGANDNDIVRGNGSFPGSWTDEDPHAGEGDQAIQDRGLTTNGELLFAALGTNGVHIRNTSGTWDHLHTSAPADLNTGTTTKVRWLKDRLMVVGNGGRSIYEVIVTGEQCSNAAPTAIRTLPVGWTFEDMFEAGPFILAPAVCPTSGQSRVFAFGLNSGATAIEEKAGTWMPINTLAYSGVSNLGRVFIGCGVKNDAGGKNPALYEAFLEDTGELTLSLVFREEDDDTSDLAVRCFEALPDAILCGWSRGNSNIHGRYAGLAYYNLARNAFALHLGNNPAGDRLIQDIAIFKNRILYCEDGGGLRYQDMGVPKDSAFLETSIADWNNAGRKVWDLFEIMNHPLPTSASIQLQYTRRNPDLLEWQDIFTLSTPGSMGTQERIEDVDARTLAIKITSTASASEGPEIQAFSARSLPFPEDTEWRLVRTVRVMDRDRKDKRAEPLKQDPRTVRARIQDLAHTDVTLYEPGVTWLAYVENVREVEPAVAAVSETAGTSDREAYYFEVQMVARRAA